MNIDEREHHILKRKFWVIAGVTLLVLAITTTIADVLDTNHSDGVLVTVLIIPSMPGFILYVLITGDYSWLATRSDRTSRANYCDNTGIVDILDSGRLLDLQETQAMIKVPVS